MFAIRLQLRPLHGYGMHESPSRSRIRMRTHIHLVLILVRVGRATAAGSCRVSNDAHATTTCLAVELLPPSFRLTEPNPRPLLARQRLNQTSLAAYLYLQSLSRDSNHPIGALTRSLPRA
ncbi:hypothetical protein BDV09DRAFT_143678 [Aspergillus tetrazonus]